jgi:hypothetical protein
MISTKGCIAGALHRFGPALLHAPAPDRDHMVTTLSSHRTVRCARRRGSVRLRDCNEIGLTRAVT